MKERADAPESTLWEGGGWTDDLTELVVELKSARHPHARGLDL